MQKRRRMVQAVGALVITEGPETRRGDALFSATEGFGPVHVPFRLEVEPTRM